MALTFLYSINLLVIFNLSYQLDLNDSEVVHFTVCVRMGGGLVVTTDTCIATEVAK